MNDKLDEILDLLRSQNEMIKDIHDYVKEVTSEKYIGESRMPASLLTWPLIYLPKPLALR